MLSLAGFQYENLYKLNTSEDSTLIHKFLGTVCFVNFIYRFSLYFVYGTMKLDNNVALFLIFTHGILSTSSLIFHLPNLRNPSKPMIYPEFRLHSILFALRSVFVCYQYYHHYYYLHQIGTCFLTMIFADVVTLYYNPKGKNGKTMRNMPFDNSISLEKQQEITKMHSIMQIGATTYMLGDIESAFSPLLAIQIAAFLMTLVRKSIITSNTWHAVYSLTLWMNIFLFSTHSIGFIILHQIMLNNYVYIFFPLKMNKYIAWSINFTLFITYKEFQIENYVNNISILNNEIIYYIKLFIIMYGLVHFFTKFRILFIK